MKFDTAWVFYRSNRAIARAAEVSDQAVSKWKKSGIVPAESAVRLQLHSRGKIKVDPAVYASR
jgi:hypothetical protein